MAYVLAKSILCTSLSRSAQNGTECACMHVQSICKSQIDKLVVKPSQHKFASLIRV